MLSTYFGSDQCIVGDTITVCPFASTPSSTRTTVADEHRQCCDDSRFLINDRFQSIFGEKIADSILISIFLPATECFE